MRFHQIICYIQFNFIDLSYAHKLQIRKIKLCVYFERQQWERQWPVVS